MGTKTEKEVRQWMREKETRPDPNHFFTIQEIREVDHVPERHQIVNHINAWELTCEVPWGQAPRLHRLGSAQHPQANLIPSDLP
jgi:hypothetical protein